MSPDIKPALGLITPETRPKAIVGVWLMILSPDDTLFVVQNRKAKYASQKVPGQLNSPAETFIPEDGNFLGTIKRAIEEEIGDLRYDESRIVRLGINKLNVDDLRVFASPYLIPVEDKDCLYYNPRDPIEADSPQWIHIEDVDPAATLRIGPYEIPYFRTPMIENVQMVKNYLRRGETNQVFFSQVTPIHLELYRFLEGNLGPDRISNQSTPNSTFGKPTDYMHVHS